MRLPLNALQLSRSPSHSLSLSSCGLFSFLCFCCLFLFFSFSTPRSVTFCSQPFAGIPVGVDVDSFPLYRLWVLHLSLVRELPRTLRTIMFHQLLLMFHQLLLMHSSTDSQQTSEPVKPGTYCSSATGEWTTHMADNMSRCKWPSRWWILQRVFCRKDCAKSCIRGPKPPNLQSRSVGVLFGFDYD